MLRTEKFIEDNRQESRCAHEIQEKYLPTSNKMYGANTKTEPVDLYRPGKYLKVQ